jgi:putative hydrolase of the HAD superfamily
MSETPVSRAVAGKKAIIFDLFHTLTALEVTWGDGRPFTHEVLGVSREAWDEQLHKGSRERLTGQKTDAFAIVRDMARAVDPSISDDVIRTAVENRIARFAGALVGIPEETERVLRTLKAMGKRIGLISNADVMEVAAWHKCPVAHLFESAVFSCRVGCAKPDRQIYEISMRELGVGPAESMFVGDGGSNELEGARGAGITTVMIIGIIQSIWPERIPERLRHADFVIRRLSELVCRD